MTLGLDTPPGVLLRPASPADYDFARALYVESTVPLLKALGARDTARVEKRFDEAYQLYPSHVITTNGENIGWLQASQSEKSVHLHQVHLVEAYRNRGIGSHLIRSLMERAKTFGLPLTLKVIRGNPAIALYLRLGFRVIGADKQRLRMRWDCQRGERDNVRAQLHGKPPLR